MKKTLFRLADILELGVAYAFCFSLCLMFDYVETVEMTSDILISFFRDFLKYQTLIIIFSTFLVVVFHYQFSCRKKTEVFCRILVGDTLFNITVRYFLNCLMILGLVYFAFALANAYLGFNLTSHLYLVPIFIVYILISARRVRKYEAL